MFFKGRRNGATAVARPELDEAERIESEQGREAAIGYLEAANRESRDLELERQIRRLRHLAGIELLENAPSDPSFAEPSAELPPIGEQSRCPEVTPEGLSPEVVRTAILSHGCLLVRGLMDRDKALAMADGIDRSFAVRDSLAPGESDPDGFYDELLAEEPFEVTARDWVQEGGGVLACDSPRLMFEMLESFKEAGLRETVGGYLGEPPALSGQKVTLRKAMPEIGGAWHQDGKFLGDVRSLNVWLSLSRCGDIAPSMDVVPKRIDHHVEAGGEGTHLNIQVGQADAEKVAGDAGIVRPIFDPGDALLFDELFLHQTGSDPSMPNPRYAIESWFFGPSAYPDGYVPIAF